LKICQICAVDFTLKTFLLPLIDAQLAEGNEVISVCTEEKYTQEMRNSGYKIKSIEISRSFNIFAHASSTYTLYKFLRDSQFDIVHVHTPIAAMIGRLAAFFARTPVVIYTAHGFYFHEDMNFLKKYFFIVLEFCFGLITDLLFTQSSEDAESAVIYKIAKKENVYAIGNGVDIKKFSPQNKNNEGTRSSLNIPHDAFVIGMICRLVKEKGVEEFLKAAEIVNKNNKNIYFILIGERQAHDHAEGVEHSIHSVKNSINDNLILTGYRSDTPELLSIMDLYVLPSWREGMPRSIIEAMMMSLPVLATNIRGSREEVIHNETGFLVPVKSPNLLAEGMLKFIDNPDWSKRLGSAGRKRALEYYDENVVLDLQIDIINKLIPIK
jgi:glycosyltransferase involved in cell wall biosynthesis